MKHRGDNAPPNKFSLEEQPKKPGFVLARFYENVAPYEETNDNLTISGYEYDEYHLELADTGDLQGDILNRYEYYLCVAKVSNAGDSGDDDGEIETQTTAMRTMLLSTIGITVPAEDLAQAQSMVAAASGIEPETEQTGEWKTGEWVTAGVERTYGGDTYLCRQAHCTQAGWDPPNVLALWTKIGDPAEEWPEWAQPVGAHDAYAAGDKVSYGGKHWVSTCDGNVWAPGVYGWTEA